MVAARQLSITATRVSTGSAMTLEEPGQGFRFVDRVQVSWVCPAGHTFQTVFAATADLPALYDCTCGLVATDHTTTAAVSSTGQGTARVVTQHPQQPRRGRVSAGKSHLDYVRERRTPAERARGLEAALEALRASGKLPALTEPDGA